MSRPPLTAAFAWSAIGLFLLLTALAVADSHRVHERASPKPTIAMCSTSHRFTEQEQDAWDFWMGSFSLNMWPCNKLPLQQDV